MRNCEKKLKISYHAVNYSLQRAAQTGSSKDRKMSRTTVQEDKYLRVCSLIQRHLTGLHLAAALYSSTRQTPVSVSTVKRQLQDAGLHGRIAKKKPYLRLTNKKKKLRWEKEHRHWTLQECKNVFWTDESKFVVFGSNRRTFVRRRSNKKMQEHCLLPSVKHVGDSVMVWGLFGGRKIGDLYTVEGTLRKESYHEILKSHAIPC